MTRAITRRSFLAAGAALSAGLAVAACSDDSPGTLDSSGNTVIKHAFGTTEIKAPPQRIVSAGYTEHDHLLALGVIPIAVTDWYGGFPFATWPWATQRLGAATPEVLNLTDGLMVDKIASLKPDLILATNAGLDKATYEKLSGIAPTVAQSGQYAFFEPWRDQAQSIGRAVFKSAEMDAVIKAVDEKFAAVAAANPLLASKTAIYLQGTLQDGQAVAYRSGSTTEFLTALKMTVPTELNSYARGDLLAYLPTDKLSSVLGSADVLLWGTDSDAEEAALRADPAIAALGASRLKHSVFTGNVLTGAINFSSPLSLTYVADTVVPLLTAALH